MSKNSPKQRIEQLQSWLEWRKASSNKSQGKTSFSKTDHYKKANKQYGYKKSN